MSAPVRPAPDARTSPLPPGEHNENPSDLPLVALLVEDLRTHGGALAPGFWALAVHRFGNWRMDVPRPWRAPLTAMYRAAYHACIALWGIDIPYNAKVGRRVRLDHHGGIHIGAWSVGDDTVFRHAVTLGVPSRDANTRSPTIGKGVEIGAGACVIGDVDVGDGAWIGANSVVAQDVPAGGAVIGNPARRFDPARDV